VPLRCRVRQRVPRGDPAQLGPARRRPRRRPRHLWPNPPTLLAQNHYLVSKVYSQTGHLIIPEIFIFSKRTWDGLSPKDQALLKKVSRETQFVERKLWDEKTATAEGDLKAKGVTFLPADKPAFYKATQPIRDKYGVKYTALLNRIEEAK
jgi:TRAP-type C4-dicarboxylate transport system substrate-binding protein